MIQTIVFWESFYDHEFSLYMIKLNSIPVFFTYKCLGLTHHAIFYFRFKMFKIHTCKFYINTLNIFRFYQIQKHVRFKIMKPQIDNFCNLKFITYQYLETDYKIIFCKLN